MDLEEIGINAGNWVESAQDRNYWRALVNPALNLRIPQAIEFSKVACVTVSFVHSRRISVA